MSEALMTGDPGMLKVKEADIWHARALEIAKAFLPRNAPIVEGLSIFYQKNFSKRKATTPTLKRPVTRQLRMVKYKKPAQLNISVENTMNSPYHNGRKRTPASNRRPHDKITFKNMRPETANLVRKQQLRPLKETVATPKPTYKTPEPLLLPDKINRTFNGSSEHSDIIHMRNVQTDEEDSIIFCSEDLYGDYSYHSGEESECTSDRSVRFIEDFSATPSPGSKTRDRKKPLFSGVRNASSTGGKS
jgi:hypothetical protein